MRDCPLVHRPPRALTPRWYLSTNLAVTAGSLYLFKFFDLGQEYFFLPVLALATVYALLYFVRQCRDRHSPFHIDPSGKNLFRRALARYLVWLVVLYGGYQLYLLTPLYSGPDYRPTHQFFTIFLSWYLWLGLPYFALTLTFKASRTEDFYDPAIRMIHVFRQILSRRLRGEPPRSVFRVLRKPYNRKVFLNLLMRAYFIPVMVEQITPTAVNTLELLYQQLADYHWLTLFFLLSAMLWLLDIVNATVAYTLESRWLENRSRSIDLTPGGWLVCLSVYPPLNEVTGSLFAFAPYVASGQLDDLLIGSVTFFYAVKVLELGIQVIHIYSDTSLGPSVTNITLKKLQTRGPYALIRHPGTASKLLMWLVQSIAYRKFWSAKFLFGYLMWGALYVLRALTEERHLSKFAEYRAYRKKVKYRFIPGLF
jgi:protein-S-isoprenylcysteine O-methyltransferase Ste14